MLSRRWAVRQENLHDTAVRIRAIGKLDGTSVGLGDLLRQRQPNAGTARLGGIERNKSVARVKQADAVVGSSPGPQPPDSRCRGTAA